MFFRAQVFQGPGPGSRVRVRVQVLEVAVKNISLEMFIGQQMKEEGHDQND